jgi:flagellar motor switch protein FliM
MSETMTSQAAAIGAMIRAGAEGGLPMLDPMAERFAFRLNAALRGLGAGGIEAEAASVRSAPFAELLAEAPVEALVGVVRARDWNSQILVLLEAGLAAVMIALLLGGPAAPAEDGLHRGLTPIERRLTQELLGLVLQALAEALAPLAPAGFEVERIEADLQFAMLAPKAATAVRIAVPVRAAGRTGQLQIVLPLPSLAVLRDAWARQRRGDADAAWAAGFQDALSQVELPAVAMFGTVTATPAEILSWKPGDTIPLPAGDADQASLVAGDRVLFRGAIGHSRGVRAVRIQQLAADGAPAAAPSGDGEGR